MTATTMRDPLHRALGASGAVLAAAAVALAAYASHAAAPGAAPRLLLAAAVAFGHGAAVLALSQLALPRPAAVGLVALLVGTLLFAGSLAGAVLLGWPTRLAPAGGMALIGGWLLLAAAVARR